MLDSWKVKCFYFKNQPLPTLGGRKENPIIYGLLNTVGEHLATVPAIDNIISSSVKVPLRNMSSKIQICSCTQATGRSQTTTWSWIRDFLSCQKFWKEMCNHEIPTLGTVYFKAGKIDFLAQNMLMTTVPAWFLSLCKKRNLWGLSTQERVSAIEVWGSSAAYSQGGSHCGGKLYSRIEGLGNCWKEVKSCW